MKEFNVIIIGGGAAGLYVAGLLGKEVNGVCLIDSKEDLLNVSFHTLGSFMDRNRFELSEKIIAASITECVLYSRHFRTIKKGTAYILDKKQLHQELLERALAHRVVIKPKTRIKNFKKAEDGTVDCLLDTSGNEYRGKIFVDASGITGVLSRPLGLQDQKFTIATGLEYNVKYSGPQNQAHLFFGKEFSGGYGWIFPLKSERAIWGYGTFDPKKITHLKEVLDRLISSAPINTLVKKDNEKLEGGTIPITKPKNRFVWKNVVCVGDSVSQVHPLIGEGYRFVLESGKLAAPHILNALKKNDMGLLTGYEVDWNKKFFASYRRGRLLQLALGISNRSDIICDLILLSLSRLRDNVFIRFLSGGV